MIWTNEVNNMLLFHMFFRSEPPSPRHNESETETRNWDELFKRVVLMLMCSRDTKRLTIKCVAIKTLMILSLSLNGRLSRHDVRAN